VVPFAFVAQPALVLVGSPMQVGVALAAVAGGLWVARRIVSPRSGMDFPLAILGTVAAVGAMFATGPEPQWPAFGLLALSATPALHTFGLSMLFGVGLSWLLSPCFRLSEDLKNH
jgi:hypothetical protein